MRAIPMHVPKRISDEDALLNEVQAADFLNLSTRTLQAWRVQGVGPLFIRAGRAIRYRKRDLIAWIEANTVSRVAATQANGDSE
jgi:phage terminase Nu1 subunit (DNA packaging protein)